MFNAKPVPSCGLGLLLSKVKLEFVQVVVLAQREILAFVKAVLNKGISPKSI